LGERGIEFGNRWDGGVVGDSIVVGLLLCVFVCLVEDVTVVVVVVVVEEDRAQQHDDDWNRRIVVVTDRKNT